MPSDHWPTDERPESLRRDDYEAVSRASPVGIFSADLDGTVTYVNPRLQQMFGLTDARVSGRSWLSYVHPDDVGALIAGWTAANAERREYEHEFRVVLADDHVRWVHGRSAVVCDAEGRPTRTVGTIEDVTVRRLAIERARGLLAISEALSRALSPEDVADAVLRHVEPVVGASSSVIALPAAAGSALRRIGTGGLPPGDRTDWELLPLDARTPLVDAVRTGEPVLLGSPDVMAAAYPDLAPVWARMGALSMAVFPLEGEAGRIGAIGFRFRVARAFRDGELAFLRAVAQQCAVTLERARLFEEARAAREEADEANRAKSEFLARMSHELRTPLNAIAGHLQLIEMGLHGPVTPGQHDALARVGRAQRHLLGLINDVLNLARLESGRVEFTVTPLLVARLLADVRPMMEPQLAAKRMTFDVRLPEDRGDAPIVVWADRDKLVQVLLNLLANAVKFTPERGAVTLELCPSDAPEKAVIVVRDDGPGIPPDRLEAIFEPFVQVDSTLTRPHQGSGLGLAISRDLARGMGGDLRAANAPGGGAEFTLSLRRAVTADGEETDRRHKVTRRTGRERRSGEDRRHLE